MSDLRTRIAAAITGIRIQRDGDAYQMADAVISELKLEAEDGECGYCHAMLPGCRYSTWKADDE